MKNPFKRPSISNALRGFNAAIDELAAVQQEAAQEMARISDEIETLTARHGSAETTYDRAAKLEARLAEIVG